ncbi:cytochrome c biogenesis protein [Fuchsiella alkaliacetigena]|uniref:cytochrome c biogenesis protein n=1 Tax=Fuchsiella alkaliacetigena TaxID=957042 RepID=UPI00200AB183|nr:cytochrome c biogenesis protein CcsA [Fuchsiella alkaliacetigena]MCK8825184.1 cytochrome c biogenesis protein CcsA [Fuchsiella alkaliacetigena]
MDSDNKLEFILVWLTFLVTSLAIYMVFIYAPTERVMGDVQRLFYFHVATAWIAFAAFFVVFIASIVYLKNQSSLANILGLASAEIGVLFTTMVLITGPLWARPIWNAWWTWDPRLTTTLILWFIYIAYILIRISAEESEKRGRLAAVFGIVGFINVPIVFMSIRWWRSIHPQVVSGGSFDLDPRMLHALLTSVAAFTLIYLYLLQKRFKVELLQEKLKDIKETLRKQKHI